MKPRFALVLLIAFAAACASLPKGPGCVQIGPRGAACLLPPAALPPVQAQHVVTVEHDGRKDAFLGQLGIDGQALRLAGASLFGTHLFSITWDGQAISVVPPREAMRPELILAMLQLALAPPERLRPQLHGLDLVVSDEADGGQSRELYQHGRLVAHIHKTAGPLAQAALSISIPPADMNLDLEPMETP